MDIKDLKAPSNWQPETSKVRIAVLSKLIEELTEAATAAARCLAQGIEQHELLQEELADAQAMIALTIAVFAFDMILMRERSDAKYRHKRAWIDKLAKE